MVEDKISRTLKLKDGRKLGYAVYGDRKGYPILYFHGFPGSRLDPMVFRGDQIAIDAGVRLIGIDRPGMGSSDFKKGRTLLDWPKDVVELVNSMGIDDYSIAGYSGGGPYALACAYKLKDHVSKIGIICGMGPYDAPGTEDGSVNMILNGNPIMERLILFGMRSQTKKDPDIFFSKATFPQADGNIMAISKVKKDLMNSMKEGMIQGIKGAYHESRIYRADWDFRLEDIACHVSLWHGDDDGQVPISVGRYVAKKIPDCKSVIMEDEGHISLPYKHLEDILRKLI